MSLTATPIEVNPDMPHPSRHPGRSRPPAARSRPRSPATHRRPTATRSRPAHGTHSCASPLPLTVWRCGIAPVDIAAGWPAPVVEKVVASFSAPSDVVALLDDDRTATDRRRSDAVAATIKDLARDVRVLPALAPAPVFLDDSAGAHLVITTLDPYAALDHDQPSAWARLLRPGGVLAVLTHTGHQSGRLVDPTGPIVTGAQAADLLYLQHIVVLPTNPGVTATAPPRSDPSVNGSGNREPAVRRPCTRHGRVHADLLIFLNTGTTAPAGRR